MGANGALGALQRYIDGFNNDDVDVIASMFDSAGEGWGIAARARTNGERVR